MKEWNDGGETGRSVVMDVENGFGFCNRRQKFTNRWFGGLSDEAALEICATCTRISVLWPSRPNPRPSEDTTMPNPFVHVELNTTDVARAKAFYEKLFTWKLKDEPMPEGYTYTMINVGKGTGGGMMKQLMPDTPSAWMPYVLVDDIETATARAEELGAKIYKGVTDVMGMGRLSIFEDPTGAVLGLWEPKKMAAPKSARRAPAKRKTAKRRAKRR